MNLCHPYVINNNVHDAYFKSFLEEDVWLDN